MKELLTILLTSFFIGSFALLAMTVCGWPLNANSLALSCFAGFFGVTLLVMRDNRYYLD